MHWKAAPTFMPCMMMKRVSTVGFGLCGAADPVPPRRARWLMSSGNDWIVSTCAVGQTRVWSEVCDGSFLSLLLSLDPVKLYQRLYDLFV